MGDNGRPDGGKQPITNPVDHTQASGLGPVTFYPATGAEAGGFGDLGLRPELLAGLFAQHLTTPTEVQRLAYPLVTSGRDMMVQSRTGTGKTLAFVLPVLQRLEATQSGVSVLVVAPTRELATQVGAVFARLGRTLGIQVATLTGGAPYGDQLRALRRGVHVVVGTPGRLVDHLSRRSLDLSGCRTVVLDEADEILDMGFQEDLEKLLGALPADKQSLLFSATLAPGIEAIARRYMRQPERLGLSSGLEASTTLSHAFVEVSRDAKYQALVNLIHAEQPELALVFCHTKAETEELSKRLVAEGFKAGFLNGDLPQPIRTRTLEAFRHHQIAILVATDVAARGIDVRGISHVFNYDIPRSAETYIHRSGRAGRAGRSGVVINLVSPIERRKARFLIQDAKLKYESRRVPQGDDVRRQMRQRFIDTLSNRIDASQFDNMLSFADELLAKLDARALVAALLQDVETGTGHLAAGYDVAPPPPEKRHERFASGGKQKRYFPRGRAPHAHR